MRSSVSPLDEVSPHSSISQHGIVRPVLLSLDGGSLEGLSTLLMLQELLERIDPVNPPKPCHVFDMIGGTGSGGLIAIMLGRLEMSVADCIEAYLHISRQAFRPTLYSKYMPRVMRAITGRSLYDGQQLENAVKDVIQACGEEPDALLETTEDDGCCKVFVCATQCRSQLEFCSYRDPAHHNLVKDIKIWEAARATLATPAYFQPAPIGSYAIEFVDGGEGANNPVFQTRECARDMWQVSNTTSFDEQIHCLVSIGAGIGQDYGAKAFYMLDDFASVLIDTEATASVFASSHEHLVNMDKYFRLTVPAGIGDIDLADTSKIQEISGRTFTYLEENCSEQLDLCVEALRRKYKPEKSKHSKQPRIDLTAFEAARTRSESERGDWWIAICLAMVILIIGIIFVTLGPPRIDPSAPIVLLMGKTGVGKSTFINTVGGRHVSTGAAPKAGNRLGASWYQASINGMNVYLVDTPGFDDDEISDLQVLKHISKGLQNSYRNGRLINGVVYLYDISQSRLADARVRELEYLKLFLGEEAFSSCVLVTNKWNLDSPSIQEKQQAFQQHLKRHLWKDLVSGGSAVMRHDGSLYSAKQIVSHLMDKPKIILQHQHERVDEGKSFWRTKVGARAMGSYTTLSGSSLGRPGPGLWDTVQDWIW